ncbi:MAG: phage shock protein PspA [Deltaproteobacteria bacterium]|nr:phage shock protein PspA [Deltaproteobacteria bacterium]
MGIFTRFRDIVSANINAMLDRAEDPEKLIRLMIREMEDTLIELKASCAGAMAETRKVERQLTEARNRERQWEERATLAVRKGRDDLAREALTERRRHADRAASLEQDFEQCGALTEQYQEDIGQLEQRLNTAREKQRMLVQRHVHANRKKQAEQEIRRMDGSDAVRRFEAFEQRIDRMEAEADLVNLGRRGPLEQAFDELSVDEDIEQQLRDLKSSLSRNEEPDRDAS